jgi:DNA polymerase I
MKKILLIDTFNFLHRAYHALPPSFRSKDGEPTNAVYGVTSMLINVLGLIKPDYAVAAMDGTKPTFRVENFTAYKAHRKPMDEDLSSQIPKVFEVLEAFGIKPILVDGYEADDVIGTVAKMSADKNKQVIIVSNDRDLWQLVNGNVMVMVPTTNGKADWLGPEEVEKRLGFSPGKLPDYKGLRGDSSDNIPGVRGIGEKTALKLIQEYGSVEQVYRNINKIEPNSLKEKLLNNSEEAVMSKQLATIIEDVPVLAGLEECKYTGFDEAKVKEVLGKYGFKSLIRRLGLEDPVDKKDDKEKEPENQIPLL